MNKIVPVQKILIIFRILKLNHSIVYHFQQIFHNWLLQMQLL